jgi:hypothetical protein
MEWSKVSNHSREVDFFNMRFCLDRIQHSHFRLLVDPRMAGAGERTMEV